MNMQAPSTHDPSSALAQCEAILSEDPLDYEASWRAAFALMAIGQQAPGEGPSPIRDSAYDRAEAHARQAVAADPAGAQGHFVLAQAIGLASLAKGDSERIKRAAEIRTEALRAIELDASHDGAFHIMGRWHAAIARVPKFQRFFARNLLGGRIFDEASWERAVTALETAVGLTPQRIDHRLALAEVYIDLERYADARVQLTAVAALPVEDAMDPGFKERSVARLGQIEGKRDAR
jgi:regulator of microtubule dynamics protein 3